MPEFHFPPLPDSGGGNEAKFYSRRLRPPFLLEDAMQNMEHFLADRALSLRYEARRFPQTASVSAAWIRRAADWALRHGFQELAHSLCCQARETEAESHVLWLELSLRGAL